MLRITPTYHATQTKMGVRKTKFHPIQQSTGNKPPMEISVKAFWNLSMAKSMRADIKQNPSWREKSPRTALHWMYS